MPFTLRQEGSTDNVMRNYIMKICSKCKTNKSEENFYKSSRTGTLESPCKTCRKERQKNAAYTNTKKTCASCKLTKSVKEFTKRWNTYTSRCTDCLRIYKGYNKFVSPYQQTGKVCSMCQEFKDFSCFSKAGSASKVRSSCKDCNKKSRKLNLYGLTESEYTELLSSQSNACKICSEKFTDKIFPIIDHNHAKPQSCRGILCDKCNKAIGLMRDNIKYLSQAITYLSSPFVGIPKEISDILPPDFKEWDRINKRKYYTKKRKVFKNYGLSVTQYDKIVQAHPNCNICGIRFSKEIVPCLDHCHTSNRVRGVLCRKCNCALGLFRDSCLNIASAKSYLEDYS